MIMHLVYRMKEGWKSKKTSERIFVCLLIFKQENEQSFIWPFARENTQASNRYLLRVLLSSAKKANHRSFDRLFWRGSKLENRRMLVHLLRTISSTLPAAKVGKQYTVR